MALRTSFLWNGLSQPTQIIYNNKPFRIEQYIFGDDSSQETINSFIIETREKGICIDKECCYVQLLKVHNADNIIVINTHHIVFDGWSNSILINDFFNTYTKITSGHLLDNKESFRYQDFVKWIKQEQSNKQSKLYWKQYMEGIRSCTLLPYNNANKQDDGHAIETFMFSLQMENKIHDFIKDYNITSATFWKIEWGLLLSCYNKTNDVVFGTTVSGREIDISGILTAVGLFINTNSISSYTKMRLIN